jgi:hypothetical protein
MHSRIALPLLVAAGVLGACSASTTYVQSAANDAGAGGTEDEADGALEDAGDRAEDAAPAKKKDGSASTTIVGCSREPSGSFVEVDNNPGGSLPSPSGGTLADGHWILDQATVMSSVSESDLAGDLWIGGGRFDWETATSDGWRFSYGGTLKVSPTRMTLTTDCGQEDSVLNWDYSATSKSLTVSFTNLNGFQWVYVLKRGA